MILGRDRHPASECFAELDDAIESMWDGPPVCLNAHAFPDEIPPGGIVYNLENVNNLRPKMNFDGHELWDFSEKNCQLWAERGRPDVVHVPVGYHESMSRFAMAPFEERHIDVVFTGCVNYRRGDFLSACANRGLTVAHIPPGVYGEARDAVLARSKISLNMLFYPGGAFPTLRAAHAVANGLLPLNESAYGQPEWAGASVPHGMLMSRLRWLLALSPKDYELNARVLLRSFQENPMTLPRR